MTLRSIFFDIKRKLNNNSDEIVFTLLQYNYQLTKEQITLHFDNNVEYKSELDDQIKRLNNLEPLQYITNEAYFLGRKLYVNNHVLIPRQETEQLVFDTKNYVNSLFSHQNLSILEIGTGSGCISVALSKLLKCRIIATDISNEALKVAKKNGSDCLNILFLQHDIFNPLNIGKFDIIISNPPYIKSEETVDKSTLLYEPHNALFANPQTKFYEEIIKKSLTILNSPGLIAFEIDENMKDDLLKLLEKYYSNAKYEFKNDIYNKVRFLYIIK